MRGLGYAAQFVIETFDSTTSRQLSKRHASFEETKQILMREWDERSWTIEMSLRGVTDSCGMQVLNIDDGTVACIVSLAE